MRRTLLASLLVVIPSIAFALDYTNTSSNYTDAPFSSENAAGISILTNLHIVSGNPDGSFAAGRTLNRAEFAKIAVLSKVDTTATPQDCFPDVTHDDWFSGYVCLAKQQGLVMGNPDGLFHPERDVNYAEAVKMLDIAFHYILPTSSFVTGQEWYTPYLIAAQAHGVALPDVAAGDFLTRGQMARLTASYIAADAGELDTYRAFENGEAISSHSSSSSMPSSSSKSAVSSSTSSSSSSSLSSSSSSSSSSSLALVFPSSSHFLVAGSVTPLLYDGTVQAVEQAKVTAVSVELFREIHSLNALRLYDPSGKLIATLSLQSYNNTAHTKWRADVSTGPYLLAGNTPMQVGIVGVMNGAGNGATSNELVEFKSVSIFTVGTQSNASQELVPTAIHNPSHQTAFGRMTGVKNTLGGSVTMQQGKQKQIGNFTVTAQLASGATLLAKSLIFELQSTDVNVTNVRIGTAMQSQQSDCASEQTNGQTFLTCLIPDALQQVSATPVTLSVFADTTVAVAKDSGIVRLVSAGNGSIGHAGVVNWTDGSGNFNWVEADYPADNGPIVTVTK